MKAIDEKPEEEDEEEKSESKAKTLKKWTEKSMEEDLPPICHGWLIVCEGEPEKIMNKEVKLPWHAGYCVVDPRQNSISCYKHEYPFVTNRMLQRNRTVRLDGDRSVFAKHWGLLLPEQYLSPAITGPHTIARSFTRPFKERIPTKERFFSISRMPSRLGKYSTVRGVPIEFYERCFVLFNCATERLQETAEEREAGRIVIGRVINAIRKTISKGKTTVGRKAAEQKKKKKTTKRRTTKSYRAKSVL